MSHGTVLTLMNDKTSRELLRDAMDTDGRTLNAIAAAAGVDPGYLSRVLRSDKPLPLSIAQKVGAILRMDVNALVAKATAERMGLTDAEGVANPTLDKLKADLALTTASAIVPPAKKKLIYPLARYIWEWRADHGNMPTRELARLTGVDVSLFDQIDHGHVPPPATLRKIANRMGVLLDELRAAADEPPYPANIEDAFEPINFSQQVRLPDYGEMACGEPVLVPEHAEAWNVWPSWMAEGSRATFTVRGQSMAGAGYRPGDVLFINPLLPGERPDPDSEVIAWLGDGATCKIYRRDADFGEYLESAPGDGGPPKKWRIKDKVRVVAEVVGHYRGKGKKK